MLIKKSQIEAKCFERYPNRIHLYRKCHKDVQEEILLDQRTMQNRFMFNERHMAECLDRADEDAGDMFEQ